MFNNFKPDQPLEAEQEVAFDDVHLRIAWLVENWLVLIVAELALFTVKSSVGAVGVAAGAVMVKVPVARTVPVAELAVRVMG